MPSDLAALIADLDVVLADIERAAARLDQLRLRAGDDVPLLAVKTIGSTAGTLRSIAAALRTAQGTLRPAGPDLVLRWHRFDPPFTQARDHPEFTDAPCVYAQTDPQGRAVRIGMALNGLGTRYRGTTGHALDAAMHASNNRVYVARVPIDLVHTVEDQLIWEHRDTLIYNQAGTQKAPMDRVALQHEGDVPLFE